jgi:hypothetical protein
MTMTSASKKEPTIEQALKLFKTNLSLLAPLPPTDGIRFDYEIGYCDGKQAAYEFVIKCLESIERSNKTRKAMGMETLKDRLDNLELFLQELAEDTTTIRYNEEIRSQADYHLATMRLLKNCLSTEC